MTTGKNKEVVRKFIDRVWNRGFVNEIPEFIDPEYEAIGLATEVLVKGIEGVKENVLATRSGFPDLRIEIDDMIAEEDRVASRLRLRGTPVHQQATTWERGAMTNPELIFHLLKNGKIIRAWSIGSTWR
jgi:predicted ester cyclase